MRKLVLFLFSAILSISMFLPVTSQVLADSGKGIELKPAKNMELMIRMVEKVDVGQPVTITVFTKRSHNTVAQAMVYALDSSIIAVPADIKNYSTTYSNYIDTAISQGLFLGYTDNDGNVEYKFESTGKYLIIAVKDGYAPGFDKLEVNIAAEKRLFIRGPVSTQVGKQAVFKVTEREHGIPVENAEVYAKKIGDISIPLVVDSDVEIPYAVENADEIKATGIFLGYSNGGGIVQYQFDEAGRYVVVALKDNYAAASKKLLVRAADLNKMTINVVRQADTGEEVVVKVFDASNNETVAGAAVYVIKRADLPPVVSQKQIRNQKQIRINGISENITATSTNGTAVIAANGILPVIKDVLANGTLVGYTNNDGQISYTFNEVGNYIFVAVKEGYARCFAPIKITDNSVSSLLIEAPETTVAGQETIISVSNSDNNTPVESAAVYILKIHLSAVPVPTISENGTATQAIILTEADNIKADRYIAMARKSGAFAGYTDSDGKISYSFTDSGRYIIAARKDGFRSGFAEINVQLPMSD